MQKTLIYFTLLVLVNYLCIKYFFAQNNTRLFSLLGLLIGVNSLFSFSANFAGLIVKRNFSFSKITAEKNVRDKTKELKFDSKAVKIAKLEELKKMIVIWRHGDRWFPKDQTHY